MSSSRSTILYVAHGSVLVNSGYRTRIISELRTLARNGWRFVLLTFEQQYLIKQYEPELERLKHELQEHEIQFICRPVPSFTASTWAKSRALPYVVREIARVARESNAALIHAQGHAAGYRALWAAKTQKRPLVTDVHGVHAAELAYSAKPARHQVGREWFDHQLIQKSDGLVFVSAEMAQYYRPYAAHNLSTIVPCCVDTARFCYNPMQRRAKRAELGFEHRLVVLYSGSIFQPWQEPGDLFEVFQSIRAQCEDAYLMVLSGDDPAKVQALAREHQLDSTHVQIHSLPHDSVPEWLGVADIGMLLRRPHLVNHVSSPTKFGEYLACGVPVVISKDVGDFSKLVKERKIGFVLANTRESVTVDWKSKLNELRNETIRAQCRKVAESELAWNGMAPRLLNLYERILVA